MIKNTHTHTSSRSGGYSWELLRNSSASSSVDGVACMQGVEVGSGIAVLRGTGTGEYFWLSYREKYRYGAALPKEALA